MKRILFFAILFFPLLAFSQGRQDSVGVKTISSLTELTANIDTSYEVIFHDPSTGKISYRASVGEFLKTINALPSVIGTSQIINATIINEDISGSAAIALSKLQNLTANRLVGRDTTGTGIPESLTVGYGLRMGTDRIDIDTVSASGLVSKSRLTNALDDVGGGSTETLKGLLGWYDVTTFGATPNDSSDDDTSPIQEAIDSAMNNGGVVYFPKGIYHIKGALQTNVGGKNPNSQLYIPQIANVEESKRIKLLGEVGMSYTAAGYGNLENPDFGVILKSTGVTGSGTYPAVLGCVPGNLVGTDINPVLVEIENIAVRVPANTGSTGPTLCGINFRLVNQAIIENTRVDIDTNLYYSVEPQNEVFGIAMPGINNGTVSILKHSRAHGYRYGVVASEHSNLDGVEVRCNYYGYALEGAAHAMNWGHVQAHWNKHVLLYDNSMFSNSGQNAYINIDLLNMETLNNGNWYANTSTSEIIDANNKIHGRIQYHVVRSLVGEQNSDWDKSGGGNVNDLALASGAYNTSIVSTFPLSITGLVAWYDASQESYSDGDGASTINDYSYSGHNLTAPASGNEPIYKNNIVNSKPVFRFDGTNDHVLNNDSIPELNSGNDFTIFVVAKQDNADAIGTVLSTIPETDSSANQYRFIAAVDTRTNAVMSLFTTDDGTQINNYLSEQASGFKILTYTNDFTASGGTCISYLGNVLQESLAWTYTTNSYNNNAIQLGAQGRGSGSGQLYLDGDIAEVIIYSGVLSSSDRTKVYNYLASKYGL